MTSFYWITALVLYLTCYHAYNFIGNFKSSKLLHIVCPPLVVPLQFWKAILHRNYQTPFSSFQKRLLLPQHASRCSLQELYIRNEGMYFGWKIFNLGLKLNSLGHFLGCGLVNRIEPDHRMNWEFYLYSRCLINDVSIGSLYCESLFSPPPNNYNLQVHSFTTSVNSFRKIINHGVHLSHKPMFDSLFRYSVFS